MGLCYQSRLLPPPRSNAHPRTCVSAALRAREGERLQTTLAILSVFRSRPDWEDRRTGACARFIRLIHPVARESSDENRA